jgi:hypothetical protein
MVPFHILTIKNATNNQDGDHAYIRLNFNFGPGFEPGTRYPNAVFLKELSFRTSDTRHAVRVVQEIKVLRSNVSQREREQAERATLVQQERLVKSKVLTGFSLFVVRLYQLVSYSTIVSKMVGKQLGHYKTSVLFCSWRRCIHVVGSRVGFQCWHRYEMYALSALSFPSAPQGRMYTLPDVWIRPNFGGKGRKVTGQLEAHSNGFRYSSPKGETLDIMYRYGLPYPPIALRVPDYPVTVVLGRLGPALTDKQHKSIAVATVTLPLFA